MRRIDFYKHLDADTPLTITLSMDQIARDCVALNYGAHRLLSALVHALRDRDAALSAKYEMKTDSQLADGIEELLNRGLF